MMAVTESKIPYIVIYTREFLSEEVLGLSRAALQMWIYINSACNKKTEEEVRQWTVSWAAIKEALHLSHSSVHRGLMELEAKLLIRRRRRGLGRVNQVFVQVPPSVVTSTVKFPDKCQEQNSGSTESETPEVSSSDTSNNILDVTSSTPLLLQEEDPPTKAIHDTAGEASQLWLRILDSMRIRIGSSEVAVWFKMTEPQKLVDNVLTVKFECEEYIDLVDDYYAEELDTVTKLHGNIRTELRMVTS